MFEQLVKGTPCGVGVDLVQIPELKALDERLNGGFVRRVFTEREQTQAKEAADYWTFLAGRYAVKEAAFKALAHLTDAKTFDYRRIETLSQPDGSPEITKSDWLMPLLTEANANDLLVSITNEGDFALAFVMARKRSPENHDQT